MSTDLPELTEDEYRALESFSRNIDIIGQLFLEGQGTREGMFMAIASIRSGLDVLEGVAERWEE